MKRTLLFILILLDVIVFSQEKSIPHIVVDSGEIQLVEQNLEINVVGHTADIRIFQTFIIQDTNSANYLFPVNLDTSLYELMVYYSDRIYSMDMRNMNNIRKQVAAENRRGKNIALNYNDNPYFISLNLTNLPIGEEIKVVVKYMKNLDHQSELKSVKLPSLVDENYTLVSDFIKYKVDLISATPIYDSKVGPHQVTQNKLSDNYISFSYEGIGVDAEIQIEFNSRGENADAGMLVYEDRNCRYILGLVEPPSVITPEDIAPREYVFVMDVSGSMNGFPIDTSKELIKRILMDLTPKEKFKILFFDGSSDFLSEQSIYATTENKQLAIQIINSQLGKGDTKLHEALTKVYEYKPDSEFNRIVVLLTDGLFNPDGQLLFGLRENLSYAQYFIFGIGYEIGRSTLQRLANTVGTKPVLITERIDAETEMNKFYHRIRKPLLRHIEVQSTQLNLNDTYPNHFNGFLSSQSTSFITKECSGRRDPKLILTGINGNEKYHEEFTIQKTEPNEDLSVLKLLWAKERIEFLLQEEERCGQSCIRSGRYRNEIIRLGEELNIATPYTSFIQEGYINENNQKGRKFSLYSNPNNDLTFHNDFDSDFDGVPNMVDECPYDKGLESLKGCPRSTEEKMVEEINRMLEGIEFDFDSYVIKPEFFQKLDTAAEIIKHSPNQQFIVEGHTDAAGSSEYNLKLSINRAQTVVNYLKRKGININQLKIVGKGDSELKHPECRPQEICDDQKNFENRRVVFIPIK